MKTYFSTTIWPHKAFCCDYFQKTTQTADLLVSFCLQENSKRLLRLWNTQTMHLQYKDQSPVKERQRISQKHSVKALQGAATTNASAGALSRFSVSEVASFQNYVNIYKISLSPVLNVTVAFRAVKWKLCYFMKPVALLFHSKSIPSPVQISAPATCSLTCCSIRFFITTIRIGQ